MKEIKVEKLKADDLLRLLERNPKNYIGSVLTDMQIESLESSPHSYSLFVDGRVMLCGGVVEYWRNRGEAWAVLDPDCKQHFIVVHAAVKRFFYICPVARIEAAVAEGFEAGSRWVKSLGFKFEGKCRKFLPDGQTAFLYARVRD